MTKTEHYQLPQWEPDDPVQRVDFNAASLAIDTALASKCEVVIGTYTCSVQAPVDQPRHISLGFRPKAVLIWRNRVVAGTYNFNYSALVLDGHPLKPESSNSYVAEIEDDGFYVQRLKTDRGNIFPDLMEIADYHYIAFR